MHQTTVRFGADLWNALAEEADRVGVSVAQYVRDAALSRLAYEAGRRAEPTGEPEPAAEPEPPAEDALLARNRAKDEVSESSALLAQSELARRRALRLRSQSERTRSRIAHQKT